MKKLYLTTVIILLSLIGFTQEKDKFSSTINIKLSCSNFNRAEKILKIYFDKTQTDIVNFKKNENKIEVDFYLDKKNKRKFDSIVGNIGYIQESEIKMSNYKTQKEDLQSQILYYQQRKEAYKKELNAKKERNEQYEDYWIEIRRIDRLIFELEKKKNNLKQEYDYLVNLEIFDDNVDLTTGDVHWVNMPGLSYDILWVENPTMGFSEPQYQGFSLKYLFTRGKSYIKLGALKSINNSNSESYTELFQFGFGQDFYTKHFGRGKHKILNLYSGYTAGGMFATGINKKNLTLPYLKIHLGLELFKSKHILIDNKVSYFIPFQQNRSFRGLVYSASFNFVF